MIVHIDQISDTPIGNLTVAASEGGLLAVEVGVAADRLISQFSDWEVIWGGDRIGESLLQLTAYFKGERRGFHLEVDWGVCTPFQERVLRAVRVIPYGQVRTYGEIATHLGNPKAARAVGRANATNPFSIVIPCHRLIGSDGTLRGYRAPDGIKTKAWLLNLEGANW